MSDEYETQAKPQPKKPKPSVVEEAGLSAADLLDKASNPTIRAGLVVQRIKTMLDAGVHPSAAAAQMNASSKGNGNNHHYTEAGIVQIGNIYSDCTPGTPLSKRTTKAFIKDQEEADKVDEGNLDA